MYNKPYGMLKYMGVNLHEKHTELESLVGVSCINKIRSILTLKIAIC